MDKYFEFDSKGKILSGKDALCRAKFELEIRGKSKPFVVSDKSLAELGVLKKAEQKMGLNDFCEYTDIPVDSSTDTVNKLLSVFTESGCDCVIAVGGGSVIDTAKGLVLMLASGADSLSSIEGMDMVIKKNETFFIAVPTTSGTGSEMTSVAVIKDANQGAKLEYISTFLLPDVAIIDPEMTAGLPKRLTASTAIDALTHAIEAYTCLMKNPIADSFATSAIKLIFANLEKQVSDPKYDGRASLGTASCLAGEAFSNSMVGAVHSIGHALGAVCKVAHGEAMAILLPHVMELNFEKCGDLYGELLFFANEELCVNTQKQERGKVFIEQVKKLLQKLNELSGLPLTLSATGKVDKANFDEVVQKALNDGSAIVNPVPLNKERVLEILNTAF